MKEDWRTNYRCLWETKKPLFLNSGFLYVYAYGLRNGINDCI